MTVYTGNRFLEPIRLFSEGIKGIFEERGIENRKDDESFGKHPPVIA